VPNPITTKHFFLAGSSDMFSPGSWVKTRESPGWFTAERTISRRLARLRVSITATVFGDYSFIAELVMDEPAVSRISVRK
jgi:hypothetical protein